MPCAGTDWATAGRPRVRAGDTILVHAGVYKYNRYEYTNDATVNRTTPLDGTYFLTADGTPETRNFRTATYSKRPADMT